MEQNRIDNNVLSHLLFHKALVDEKEDKSRINKYIEMVEKTGRGGHLSIENPFDRSIAIAFELVIKQHLNPWDIDLVSFSTMYLKRAREEKIDLMTAGRIIYMAWRILKLQSDDLVINIETHQENIDENSSVFNWDDIPTGAWCESDDGYSYTNLVMKMPQPPIEEPIRRQAERPVTLMELLDAFDQARKEAEEYQLLDKIRRQERERIQREAREHMRGTAHEDHIEEDVMSVWEKINRFPTKSMTINDLCDTNNHEEFIKTLMSILFLAYDNKIKVYQRRFPYGKIYIKNIGYT
ncbi:MAG: hypothetical protein DRN08_02880 [Thermoplasmata archaeon]|nr:MAG: hypothetical protein DRN05_00135 [Thermoplasmata archaeon]RLF35547.1 MAG: hypothetical protein DRN08_02880 [Thermoplasmata archaeon]